MAVSANALSLAEYAVGYSNPPLARRVAMTLLERSSVLADIPLPTRSVLRAKGVRFTGSDLPTPSWAPLNQEPTVVKATPAPFEEQLYVIRNQIHVDRRLIADSGQIVNPVAAQVNAYLRSVAYTFDDAFFNNSHTAGDTNAIVGIRTRLDNPTVYAARSVNKINAGGVDMTQGAMTATTANNFIELIDSMLSAVGSKNGDGVTLYMNETLHRRFARGIRMTGSGAGFRTDRDAFDRVVEMYRGAKVSTVGTKKDESTQIITNTETSGGADGASTYTSVYAVRWGDLDGQYGLSGWQMEDLNSAVRDNGLDDTGVIYRVTIDWGVGLYPVDEFGFARAYNIKIS